MTENNNKDILSKEYERLISELRKELPNIVLPSMGMFDDIEKINIEGRDYIIKDDNKEV